MKTSDNNEFHPITYIFIGAIIGCFITFGIVERYKHTLSDRWEAVTGTALEEAEQRVKACQPCVGVLATKNRVKR